MISGIDSARAAWATQYFCHVDASVVLASSSHRGMLPFSRASARAGAKCRASSATVTGLGYFERAERHRAYSTSSVCLAHESRLSSMYTFSRSSTITGTTVPVPIPTKSIEPSALVCCSAVTIRKPLWRDLASISVRRKSRSGSDPPAQLTTTRREDKPFNVAFCAVPLIAHQKGDSHDGDSAGAPAACPGICLLEVCRARWLFYHWVC